MPNVEQNIVNGMGAARETNGSDWFTLADIRVAANDIADARHGLATIGGTVFRMVNGGRLDKKSISGMGGTINFYRLPAADIPNAPELKDGRTAFAVIEDGITLDVFATRATAEDSHREPYSYVAPVRWDRVCGQWFVIADNGDSVPPCALSPIPAADIPRRIADIASDLAEVNAGESSADAREHATRLAASLRELVTIADDDTRRDLSDATLALAGLARLYGGRDDDARLCEIIVSDDVVPSIATYAREWASDCQWADMPLALGDLSDSTVIACAARVYDGGLAAIIADAAHDMGDAMPADVHYCQHCGIGQSASLTTCPDCEHATGADASGFGADPSLVIADESPRAFRERMQAAGDETISDTLARLNAPDMPALTIATLQRIASRAVNDHAGDSGYGYLAPHNVTITAINPPSDLAFDRCSYGKSRGETFAHNGWTFRIQDYHGSGAMPWRIVPAEETASIGNAVECISDRELADKLNAARPHPDPYVASVECTYDIRGHRALYGVRTSGELVLWAD